MNRLAHSRDLGIAELFPLAREAILNWELHDAAGVLVRPRRRVDEGLFVELRLNPAWPLPPRRLRGRDLTIPVGSCEVTEVIDSEDRAGFTYRAQPDHLVGGDETFLVSIGANGRLGVTITSTSVPSHPVLRATAPVAVAGQRIMARRYAGGLRRLLAGDAAAN